MERRRSPRVLPPPPRGGSRPLRRRGPSRGPSRGRRRWGERRERVGGRPRRRSCACRRSWTAHRRRQWGGVDDDGGGGLAWGEGRGSAIGGGAARGRGGVGEGAGVRRRARERARGGRARASGRGRTASSMATDARWAPRPRRRFVFSRAAGARAAAFLPGSRAPAMRRGFRGAPVARGARSRAASVRVGAVRARGARPRAEPRSTETRAARIVVLMIERRNTRVFCAKSQQRASRAFKRGWRRATADARPIGSRAASASACSRDRARSRRDGRAGGGGGGGGGGGADPPPPRLGAASPRGRDPEGPSAPPPSSAKLLARPRACARCAPPSAARPPRPSPRTSPRGHASARASAAPLGGFVGPFLPDRDGARARTRTRRASCGAPRCTSTRGASA